MKLLKPTWIHHDGHPIYSIDIHPDDTHFATGGQGDDKSGRVVIWNLKTVFKDPLEAEGSPKLLCQLDHHNACVNCVRWSHSGSFLSSAGDDKVIIIWKLVSRYTGNPVGNSAFQKNNLEIWKSVSILRGHDGDVLDLAWSPEDTYLASCSIDNTVKIWDAQNFPQVVTTLKGHTGLVKGVTWDPIEKYLASQSDDKTLRIWRTSDWTTEHVVEDPFVDCGGTTHVLRLGWSPDGMYLVSAHAMNYGFPTAQIIDREGWKTDKDFVGHRRAVVCVRFNKNILDFDGTKQGCVAIGSRDRSISVWSTALKRPVVVVKDAFSHSVMDLTWSHCGTIMMACSSEGSVLAAQFTSKEIGNPIPKQEMVDLLQRKYGENAVKRSSRNFNNLVRNLDICLAMNKQAQEKELKEPVEENHVLPENVEIKVPPPKKYNDSTESIIKGPVKQIETRTADGKRRITPKFLPLPNEDNLVETTIREECTVFKSSEGVSSDKTGDNLRESMVSSIEEVSFGERNKMTPKDAQKNAVSKLESPPNNNKPKPMEVDLSPVLPSVVMNGTGSSHSDTDKPSNGSSPSVVDVNGVHTDSNTDNVAASSEKNNEITVVINGGGSSVPENSTNKNQKDAGSSPQDEDKGCKAPSVNVIQVKRKRSQEELKQLPQNAKKRFTPQSLRTFATKKSGDEQTPRVTETPTTTSVNRTPVNAKSTCSSKCRLPQLKIDSTLAMHVKLKLDASFSLEVNNNHKRKDGLCHQIKCQHSPTSLQGLEWIICTDAPICAISGDMHRIVALCEDATAHVLDLKGRYAMSPFVLSGYPTRLLHSGPFVLVITVKAVLQMWNIHTKSIVIKSESLLPILNQPGGSDPDKSVDIANIYTALGGIPVIFLSNGKSFIFNKEMCTWSLFSDSVGLVSSPIMPDAGELATNLFLSKLSGRRRKPEPAIISHIKLQLIRATELKKENSIKQWMLVLGKTLATHGLEKELHILCEDLLGPTHSSANSSVTWNPKVADCVDKRSVLREILNSLLNDLRWQDFFCEFDELLREVDPSPLEIS